MKLLIDARTVRPRRTGVGYYTESMTQALAAAIGVRGSLTALSLYPEELPLASAAASVRKTSVDYESHPLGEIYENVYIPWLLKRENFDLFWGPAFLIPWIPVGAARVVTIHDLTVFTHPECYPARFRLYMRSVIRQAIYHSDAVVCVSQWVADQIREMFNPRGVITAIPAAADPFFSPALQPPPLASKGSYLLAIGAGDPRKDTAFLLRLYRQALACSDGNIPDLVLVGDWPETDLGPRVRLLPRLSRETLRDLYRGATLFLYPTASEGFGIPVLEAMQCGCPVAASSVGAIPEVAGEAALLFDHTDELATSAAIVSLLQDPARLAWMRAAGIRRSLRFSWASSASDLFKLFETTVEHRKTK